MPFSNITGDPNDAWIGAGIAETLMADLQRAHGFTVIDPKFVTEAMNAMGLTARASNGEAALLAVARRVGAQRMITGGYQRLGDQIRITGRLVEVQTGLVARAAKVDGALGELFGLQDQIVGELVNGTSAMADLTPEPAPVPPPAVSTVAEPEPSPVDSPSTGEAGGVAALSLDLPFVLDGPPPPVPPETISRDGSGRATIRAVRLTSSLRLDGQLDEAVYASVPPMSDFIQSDPQEGMPATEKTEVWVFYDEDYVYVSARCWESHPERMVVNVMQRDSSNIMQNENFGFMFDTFYDQRNGVLFIVTPIGGSTDGQVIDRRWSRDWNTVWNAETARFEGGWTVEIAVPFKSLRYGPGRTQVWGFNARRINRWKNEVSHLTRVPNTYAMSGLFQASLSATMVGLEVPSGAKNVEIKPFAIANVASDLNVAPKILNDLNWNGGVDVKYGITQNLTADFTYNTDFAQVEADEQQVNLTRFSLFFPEKREFFLENRGTFAFGGAGVSRGGATSSDTPILFYSRRIGLNQGRAVPIQVGGRLTGRLGAFNLGVINIQTDDEPVSGAHGTNFSVVRVKRDVLRKSSIGVIFTGRSVGQSGLGTNEAYGVDGTFAFFDNLFMNTYWAQTRTDGLSGEDTSYRAQLDYAGDRYGVQLERLVVGANFNPEVGFVRRDDMRRSFGQFRFSPRPDSDIIRQFSLTGSVSYIENGVGRLEARDLDGEFEIDFHSSDRFTAGYSRAYEFLPRPFRIAPDVTLPIGGYDHASWRVGVNFGQQRMISGNLSAEWGTFFSGHTTAISFQRARTILSSQLSVEPTYSVNWVDLVEGSFTTHLVGSRVTYTMTPRMFASSLLQYSSNSHEVLANLRLRWEYQPGSELFVVYTEQRDARAVRFPALANRTFVVKINRLFRF